VIPEKRRGLESFLEIEEELESLHLEKLESRKS
jgi:hypothetical protein